MAMQRAWEWKVESRVAGRLEMEVGVELMEIGEIMLNVVNVGFCSVVKSWRFIVKTTEQPWACDRDLISVLRPYKIRAETKSKD